MSAISGNAGNPENEELNVDLDELETLSSVSSSPSYRKIGERKMNLAAKVHRDLIYVRLMKLKTLKRRPELEKMLTEIREKFRTLVKAGWSELEYEVSITKLHEILGKFTFYQRNQSEPNFDVSLHKLWVNEICAIHHLEILDIANDNLDYIRESAKWLYLATENFLEATSGENFHD